jgi:hypothetical protein
MSANWDYLVSDVTWFNYRLVVDRSTPWMFLSKDMKRLLLSNLKELCYKCYDCRRVFGSIIFPKKMDFLCKQVHYCEKNWGNNPIL